MINQVSPEFHNQLQWLSVKSYYNGRSFYPDCSDIRFEVVTEIVTKFQIFIIVFINLLPFISTNLDFKVTFWSEIVSNNAYFKMYHTMSCKYAFEFVP